jgi:molybdate transport system substrate-binding protein
MITRVALVFASTLLLSACDAAAAEPPVADHATVDVYAASSLTDVFSQLAEGYESAHPGVEIRLTFAGSADLAAHINEGAPADVFAAANQRQLASTAEHVDGGAQVFASNTLVIAVPLGNPGGVTDFASLASPELAVVVCAPEVPCGAAAVALEASQGVTLSPVSELSSVTDVLGTVASGEADAGLVYVTDLDRADGVEGIALAGSGGAPTSYPIAVMMTGDARVAARGFVDYVLGTRGQATLAAAGFAPPRAAVGK